MTTATELLNAYLNKVNRTDDAQVIEDLERERKYVELQNERLLERVERLERSISELDMENIRLAEDLRNALRAPRS